MDSKQRSYLLETYDLDQNLLDRLVADSWSFSKDTPEVWIQKRHRQLQASGLRNDEIFAAIGRELNQERFAAPKFSPRQLRRIIYG